MIGVQLYTFRHELARDPERAIAGVARTGVAGVEAVAGQVAPRRLRGLLDAHGLVACGVHGTIPEGRELDAALDELEILGADLLIASTLKDLAGIEEGDFDAALARFDAAAEAAAARGMRVGYHNHWWEWDRGDGAWESFWALVDARVVAEVDAYWAQVAGRDPAELVAGLGERAAMLHIKDGPLVHGAPMVALGDGAADVTGPLQAAEHARWVVIELDDVDGDPFVAVRDSVRWLDGVRA